MVHGGAGGVRLRDWHLLRDSLCDIGIGSSPVVDPDVESLRLWPVEHRNELHRARGLMRAASRIVFSACLRARCQLLAHHPIAS
jgi:hypothetical protein